MTDQEPTTGAVWDLIQSWMDSLRPYPPSQRRLAAALEVSPSTVSDYKYKRSMPAPDAIDKLAAEIRVPAEVVLDAFLRDQGYRVQRRAEDGRERGAS
jgi:transcriptional regulator with XRE-family HTH domain